MTDINNIQDTFVIDAIDSKIWNWYELVAFLVAKQGRHVRLEIQEGLCLEAAGVYQLLDLFKFKSVGISTLNMVEQHDRYKVKLNPACLDYFKLSTEVDYQNYHIWNKKKVFGAIYARPVWSRMGLASHLYNKHLEKSMINFRTDVNASTQRKTFELTQLFEVDSTSTENFMTMQEKLPILIDDKDTYTLGGTAQSHTDQLKNFYANFLIDIVAETYTNGRSFYVTEKTTRPMLMKKPFIVHGSKCFLIHLRQMGFRTFNDFWNEDYDGYSPDIKYHKILQLIDHLATLDLTQLDAMYKNMQTVLDHNYNLLITQSYSPQVTYVA